MTQPNLETERLILRAMTLEDAPRVTELLSDFEVVKKLSQVPYPYNEQDAEDFIDQITEGYKWGKAAVYALTQKSDGLLVGAIGLTISPAHSQAELGYWLGHDYWGKGYMTEAARALVQYGFETLKLNRVYSSHYTGNPASGNVMKKLGMTYEGTQRQHVFRFDTFHDLALYGILREEWDAQK